MRSYKGWILKTGFIFVVILLIFTFFSTSIYTFNLPKVSVDFPVSEILADNVSGMGVVDFIQKEEIFSKYEGMIILLVKEGDLIREGRSLFQIKMDTDNIRRELNAIEDALFVLKSNITATEIQKTELRQEFLQSGQQISNEAAETAQFAETLLEYAIAISDSSAKIRYQERELLSVTELYQAGRASKTEYDSLKALIATDEEVRTKQKQEKETFIEEINDSGADKDFNSLFNQEILTFFQECHERLANYQLELQALENQQKELTEILTNHGTVVVTAFQDMVITKASETLLTGVWIESNTMIYEAGLISGSFYAEVPIQSNNFKITTNSKHILAVPSVRIFEAEGNITNVFEENGVQIVRIEFFDYKLLGGEIMELKISYTSERYELVLPKQAIHYGDMGAFVLVVDEVKTSLGSVYYAREVAISILESSQNKTAIGAPSDEKLSVIVSSDSAILSGDKIRMVDKSEIIETR